MGQDQRSKAAVVQACQEKSRRVYGKEDAGNGKTG